MLCAQQPSLAKGATPDAAAPDPVSADLVDLDGRSERAVALHVQSNLTSSKKKVNRRTQLNLRIDAEIKHLFQQKCLDEGKDMSKVVTNLVKAFVGICLIFISWR